MTARNKRISQKALWPQVADYNQAIELNPCFADVWFNRATCWQRKEEWARAEADFTEYIVLKPQHADAYASRGILRLRQGRAVEAQQDFAQCLRLNPNLRRSAEEMIEEAKQQMTRRRPPR